MTCEIIGYNIYEASDGCDPVFYGRVTELSEVAALLAKPGVALPASLWDTARAAGHCGGARAPEGIEANEPCEWFDGDICAVAVYSE